MAQMFSHASSHSPDMYPNPNPERGYIMYWVIPASFKPFKAERIVFASGLPTIAPIGTIGFSAPPIAGKGRSDKTHSARTHKKLRKFIKNILRSGVGRSKLIFNPPAGFFSRKKKRARGRAF